MLTCSRGDGGGGGWASSTHLFSLNSAWAAASIAASRPARLASFPGSIAPDFTSRDVCVRRQPGHGRCCRSAQETQRSTTIHQSTRNAKESQSRCCTGKRRGLNIDWVDLVCLLLIVVLCDIIRIEATTITTSLHQQRFVCMTTSSLHTQSSPTQFVTNSPYRCSHFPQHGLLIKVSRRFSLAAVVGAFG